MVRGQTWTERRIVQKSELRIRGKVAVAAIRREADQMADLIRIGNGHPYERGDIAGRGRDFADDGVVIVRDEDISRGVHGDAIGLIELGAHGRISVAGVSTSQAEFPRYGGDLAVGSRDLPDQAVNGIRDEDVPSSIHGHAEELIELGARGQPAHPRSIRSCPCSPKWRSGRWSKRSSESRN